MNSRRSFFKKAALAAGALTLGSMEMLQAAEPKKGTLKDGAVILFQGDSITDAGRDRKAKGVNASQNLGTGYALLAAAQLLSTYPMKNLKIFNKGISGSKVPQTRKNWDRDCIELKPDVVSILLGVNDFWHMTESRYDGTLKSFEDDYREMLQYTKDKLPNAQIIIGEPFGIINGGVVKESWYPEFDKYRAVTKKLAKEFEASFVPYQEEFDKVQKQKKDDPKYWVRDGVHPTLAGAAIMAKAWLAATGF